MREEVSVSLLHRRLFTVFLLYSVRISMSGVVDLYQKIDFDHTFSLGVFRLRKLWLHQAVVIDLECFSISKAYMQL